MPRTRKNVVSMLVGPVPGVLAGTTTSTENIFISYELKVKLTF